MFKEKNILPFGPTSACGLALTCIWDVHADVSYDVPVERAKNVSQSLYPEGGEGFIAVRTFAGKGRVYLRNDEVIELKSNTLVLLEWNTLKRYHCAANLWHFLWFEFLAYGPLHIPLCQEINLSDLPDETKQLSTIMKAFQSQSHNTRRMASAWFLALLYERFAQHMDKVRGPHESTIEKIINRMYGSLADKRSVAALAREAGMSEAWFRREFKNFTGCSPKIFMDRLRLAWADELLRTTSLSVSEIAYKLGYLNPFHFSKAFSRHYHCPPSTVRRPSPATSSTSALRPSSASKP